MSLGKDRYYQAKGSYEGGSSVDQGDYFYTKEELANICHVDNHHLAGVKDSPNMRLNAQMIIEKYGSQEGIMKALFTNSKTGIESSSIKDRKRIYGENSFPPPQIKTIMELIMENFEDFINRVLLAAALVSLVIGLYKEGFPTGLIEGTSIAIALVIICTVTSVNNWFSEKRLAELVALSDVQEVAVFRDSDKATTIEATELVVGDLVKISMGEKVPADMMMVEGQDVQTNESELTGEPDNLDKVPVTESNYKYGVESTMLCKSLLVSGVGKAIVMAVGGNTVAGVITLQTQKPPEPTLLQTKLEDMAGKIGNIGTAVAIATFLASVVRIIIESTGGLPCGCQNLFVCKNPIPDTCEEYDFGDINNEVYPMLLEAIIIGITVIVVAIPEGLPLAVTISLSFSSAKMQKLNNLVRKIASSETMGGATHICSDKTGTLTLNKMTVMATMASEIVIQSGTNASDEMVTNARNTYQGISSNDQTIWDTLFESIMWNSSAWIEKNDGKDKMVTDEYLTKGNVTEQGIMKFFMNAIGANQCLGKKGELNDEKTLCIVPFTSKRKMGSIVVHQTEFKGTNKEVRVYCKGAPDMLLEKVLFSVTRDGSIMPIENKGQVPQELLKQTEGASAEDTYRGFYNRCVKNFADQAYRTILVTYKDMSMEEFEKIKTKHNNFEKEADREILETNLIAVGLFGLQDPLRPTIVDSIKQCHSAGIQVIMCTGDNIDTAIAISKNAGIVTEEEVQRNEFAAMTGKKFREAVGGLKKMKDNDDKEIDVVRDMSQFKVIKKQLKVLARSSPEDKLILVRGIQDSDGVVAVTGDGTNDAPALKNADVGFSMGITGTDVAKGASDIILLDDNFSSIIVALKYGRNVYDNVRMFLQFQLTVNYVAMFIVFLGAVVTKKSPLNAVQMLWVNLIMDTFAALALATEPPAATILERQPYKKDNPVITPIMGRNVQGHAIYQIIVLLVILFSGPSFLIDNQYELQCAKYNDGECDTKRLNPFYTKTEYYEPELWKDFLTGSQQGKDEKLMHTKPDLRDGMEFDSHLLYKWRCNLFTQDNYEYANNIETIKLCKLDDPVRQFTDPMTYSLWLKEKQIKKKDQEIIKEFVGSWWHLIDPTTEKKTEVLDDGDEKIYTSKGMMTEETKLFSLVFNAFVFMQVFNQINARKLEEGEFNVFGGMIANMPFLGIMVVTIIVQLAMVEYGGRMVKCWPLNIYQNAICIVIGLGELPWGVLIKFVPTRFFLNLALEDKKEEGAQKKVYLSQAIKGSKVNVTTK